MSINMVALAESKARKFEKISKVLREENRVLREKVASHDAEKAELVKEIGELHECHIALKNELAGAKMQVGRLKKQKKSED